MQVFKLCMKIIKKNKITMMIYVFIFLGIAITVSLASAKAPGNRGYTAEKTSVAFYSEENTPLVAGLKQELSKSADFVSIPDTLEARQDALFYRNVTYIVRVPKGFTEKFLKGEKVNLERTSVPDSVYNAFLNMKIDRYLNTAAFYVKGEQNITQAELVEHLKNDMDKTVSVQLNHQQHKADDTEEPFTSYYYNYLFYCLTAVLIFGVSVIMEVFNDHDLRSRTFCSPIRPRNYSGQYLLAISIFSVAVWLVLLLPCMVLDPVHFFTRTMPYQLLNSFACLLSVVGISFLVGNLVKGKEAISAVANVCALGPSFISGVFIPQRFLNDTVLKVASFTPAYWYVKANETLGTMKNFSAANLAPVINGMLMQLLFAAAFVALGLVAGKRRRLAA